MTTKTSAAAAVIIAKTSAAATVAIAPRGFASSMSFVQRVQLRMAATTDRPSGTSTTAAVAYDSTADVAASRAAVTGLDGIDLKHERDRHWDRDQEFFTKVHHDNSLTAFFPRRIGAPVKA